MYDYQEEKKKSEKENISLRKLTINAVCTIIDIIFHLDKTSQTKIGLSGVIIKSAPERALKFLRNQKPFETTGKIFVLH